MKKFAAIVLIALVAQVSFLTYSLWGFITGAPALGATIPTVVALFESSLASKITSSATSATLVTGTDKQGNSLSGTYGFIIDEGSANEEFVVCTATATALTSCLRGVSVTDGDTEVTALKKEHRRGATVKITNYPQLAILSRILNGQETIPNRIAYQTHPSFVGTAASTSLATKKYVDDTNNVGAADATTTVQGLVEISTQAELVAGTGTGGTGAVLVIPGNYFTSSSSAQKVPVLNSTGYLDSTFINIDSLTLEFTGDNKLGVSNVSSSSFSDAIDKLIRSDGDSLPTTSLWIPISRFNVAASASGDLIVRGASSFGRLASAGADNYILTSSSSFSNEMTWRPINDYIGTAACSSGIVTGVPSGAGKIWVQLFSSTFGTNNQLACEVEIFKNGKTVGGCREGETNAGDSSYMMTATYDSANNRILASASTDPAVASSFTHGTEAGEPSCTVYYYR